MYYRHSNASNASIACIIDTVDALQARVAERGVDVSTEAKLQQIRRETDSELDIIKSQVSLQDHGLFN